MSLAVLSLSSAKSSVFLYKILVPLTKILCCFTVPGSDRLIHVSLLCVITWWIRRFSFYGVQHRSVRRVISKSSLRLSGRPSTGLIPIYSIKLSWQVFFIFPLPQYIMSSSMEEELKGESQETRAQARYRLPIVEVAKCR